jgi:Toprim domain
MNLSSLARALGGEVSGRNKVSIPTPGHSRRDRGTTITLDPSAPGGFLVHSFNGGDPLEIKDMVRRALGMPAWEPGDAQDRRARPDRVKAWDQAAVDREAEEAFTWTEDERRRIDQAAEIWDGAGDPRGTLAETYLRRDRCLDLSDDLAGHVLRFHPQCPWRDENTGKTIFLPALIAAFRSVDDGTLTAVHRIALRPDGSKIDRRMLGIMHRVAVKIGTPVKGDLAIGEGIETSMAARHLHGFDAAWALGSAGAVAHFPLIDHVNHLILLGERDQTSGKALLMTGERWRRAGRRVSVVLPKVGKDLNDEWIARQQQ